MMGEPGSLVAPARNPHVRAPAIFASPPGRTLLRTLSANGPTAARTQHTIRTTKASRWVILFLRLPIPPSPASASPTAVACPVSLLLLQSF